MPLTLDRLADLPSPFYRVAVKALIFDDQNRLLVVFNENGEAEIPGGGWEHGESLEDCVRRELAEEIGAGPQRISGVQFTFQSHSDEHGWNVLRVVVEVALAEGKLQAGDEMTALKFVTKDELLQLHFASTDAPITQFAEQIWRA